MHSTANPPGVNILYWSASLQLLKNSQSEVESLTTQDVAWEHARSPVGGASESEQNRKR